MDAIKAAAAAADNGAQPGAAPTFLTALAQAAEGAQRNAVSANVAVPDVATIKLQAKTAKRRAQAVKRDPKTGLEIKNEWQRDTDIMYGAALFTLLWPRIDSVLACHNLCLRGLCVYVCLRVPGTTYHLAMLRKSRTNSIPRARNTRGRA